MFARPASVDARIFGASGVCPSILCTSRAGGPTRLRPAQQGTVPAAASSAACATSASPGFGVLSA